MSEQVTEIVYIPLKAGLDLESGEAKHAWDSILSTLTKQPGLKSLFWGRQIEDKETLQMVIVWDSLDAHHKFTASPAYKPFLETLSTHISAAAPTLFHVSLPLLDNDATALLQPVTECVAAYFPASHSTSTYTANFSTFAAEATQLPGVEAKGIVGGWSVEPHQHESLGEGDKGKMFAAFIGWPSVDAHLAFRKTEGFARIIGYLRGGAVGVKVWHVAFQQYK